MRKTRNNIKLFVLAAIFTIIVTFLFGGILFYSLIYAKKGFISSKPKKEIREEEIKERLKKISYVPQKLQWCHTSLIRKVQTFPSNQGNTVEENLKQLVKAQNGYILQWTIKEDYKQRGVCWVRVELYLNGEKRWLSWRVYPALKEQEMVEPTSPLSIELTDRLPTQDEIERVKMCADKLKSELNISENLYPIHKQQFLWSFAVKSNSKHKIIAEVDLGKDGVVRLVDTNLAKTKKISCGLKKSICNERIVEKVKGYFSFHEKLNLWEVMKKIAYDEEREKGVRVVWKGWNIKEEAPTRCLISVEYEEGGVPKKDWIRYRELLHGNFEVEPLGPRVKEAILGPGVGRENN